MLECDPKDLDELNARVTQNQRVEGYGLDVTSVFPCPVCGHPDWMRWNLHDSALDDYAKVTSPHECAKCGRVIRMVLDRPNKRVIHQLLELVGGPDLPDWIRDMKPAPFILDKR